WCAADYRMRQRGGGRGRPGPSLPTTDVPRNAAPGPGPSAVVTAAVVRTTRRAARRDLPPARAPVSETSPPPVRSADARTDLRSGVARPGPARRASVPA